MLSLFLALQRISLLESPSIHMDFPDHYDSLYAMNINARALECCRLCEWVGD